MRQKIVFFIAIAALVTPSLTFAAPFPFNILASVYDQLRQRALELVGGLEEKAKEEGIPFVPSQPVAPSSRPSTVISQGTVMSLLGRVEAVEDIRIRSSPSPRGTVVGTAPKGSLGSKICGTDGLVDGFSCPTVVNGIPWWYINWDSPVSLSGWSAEKGIRGGVFLEDVPTPFIQNIAPPEAPAGSAIAILGYSFITSDDSNTVKFLPVSGGNSTNVDSITADDDEAIELRVPDIAPGKYNVSVINPNGISNSVLFTVTADASSQTSTFQMSSCPSFDYIFDKFLQLGSQGCDTAELQSALATDASLYPEKAVNGFFDAPTENAVKKFQTRHNLASSGDCLTTGFGCVGSKTRAKLNEAFGKEVSGGGVSGDLSQGSTGGWTLASLQQRKSRILSLAKTDPSRFLNEVMSSSERTALPSDLKALVEFPIDLTTKIDVLHEDDFKNFIAKYFYFLRKGKERLQFYPDGKLPPLRSSTTVRVKGFQLENTVVASITAQNFQVITPAAAPVSTGTQKMAVLLLNFLDSPPAPKTREEMTSIIFNGQMQKYFREQSYGKVSWAGDVYGWYTVQREGDPNGTCQTISIDEVEILNLIAENNINLANYDHLLLIPNHGCGAAYSDGTIKLTVGNTDYMIAVAAVRGSADVFDSQWQGELGTHPFSWTSFDGGLSHELGHNLGVLHANNWDCGQGVVLYGENCFHNEYGNYYDVMGNGSYATHFNALYKDVLKWFDDSSIVSITSSGRYTLQPLENSSGMLAAKIQPPSASSPIFYMEYRNPIGFDAKLSDPTLISNTKGLLINWLYDVGEISNGFSRFTPRLLDMNPIGEEADYTDWQQAALNGNIIFQDEGNGITIGPIINANASGITFDVKIGEASCLRGTPRYFGSSQPGIYTQKLSMFAGGEIGIGFQFINEDSYACGSSSFAVMPEVPSGFGFNVTPKEMIVAPGQKSSPVSFTINVPLTVIPAIYTFPIKITNLTTGTTTILFDMEITVLDEKGTFVLTPPSATIQVGSTQTFEGRYDADGPDGQAGEIVVDPKLIIWSSSNKDIATIESPGVFKGVSEGLVTITGTYYSGTTNTTADAVLSVGKEKPPPPPPPDTSTFVIVPDVSTIKVGESVTLKGIYDPDGPDGEKPEQTILGSGMSWTVPLVDGKEIVTMTEGGTFKGIAPGSVKVSGTVMVGGVGESKTASATINVVEELEIVTTSLPEGVAGTYYSVVFEAKGGLRASGDVPYHWELSGTLPPIVGFDSLRGKLYGTITSGTKGTYDIVVTVIDDTGTRVSKPLTLTVKRFGYDAIKGDITITTTTLPDAQLNQYYETYFKAEGGDPSSYYWYYAGRLPGGITFFHNEGKYAGTPLETGIFRFILQVSDAQGHLDTQPVSITIYPLSPSLKVVPERSTVKVGEMLQLGAVYDLDGSGPEAERVLAGNESAWQSSDSSIVTVENRLVRGIQPGQAIITAQYQGLSAQASINVEQTFFDCRWREKRERSQGQCTGEESCSIFGQWSGNIENLRCPPPPEPPQPPPDERRFFDCQWGETRSCASGDRNSCQGTESCTVLRRWSGRCENVQCPDDEEKRRLERERDRLERERERIREQEREQQRQEEERKRREDEQRRQQEEERQRLERQKQDEENRRREEERQRLEREQRERQQQEERRKQQGGGRRNALPALNPFADLLKFFMEE